MLNTTTLPHPIICYAIQLAIIYMPTKLQINHVIGTWFMSDTSLIYHLYQQCSIKNYNYCLCFKLNRTTWLLLPVHEWVNKGRFACINLVRLIIQTCFGLYHFCKCTVVPPLSPVYHKSVQISEFVCPLTYMYTELH